MKNLSYKYCLAWAKRNDLELYETLMQHRESSLNMNEISRYIRMMKDGGKK